MYEIIDYTNKLLPYINQIDKQKLIKLVKDTNGKYLDLDDKTSIVISVIDDKYLVVKSDCGDIPSLCIEDSVRLSKSIQKGEIKNAEIRQGRIHVDNPIEVIRTDSKFKNSIQEQYKRFRAKSKKMIGMDNEIHIW